MPWAAWQRRSPYATITKPTKRPCSACAKTSCAKSARARWNLGRSSRAWFRSRKRYLTNICPRRNQIRPPPEPRSRITAENLLEIPKGSITEAGLRRNIDVALQYLESWLRGNGCVPIYNLMEDAATAEISRTQIWQWIRYGARLDDGRTITTEMHDQMLQDILNQTRNAIGEQAFAASKFQRAADLLRQLSKGEFREFLTTTAYQDLA